MQDNPVSSVKFDIYIVSLTTWVIGWLYVDVYAHNHEWVDTFFTPWHAMMYLGGAALLSTYAVILYKGKKNNTTWSKILPRGYNLAIVGSGLIMAGGGADLAWHSLFGFEVNAEALISPPHLMLMTGLMMNTLAPVSAYWQRKGDEERISFLKIFPVLTALLVAYSTITVFTNYAHHARIRAAGTIAESDVIWATMAEALGLASMQLQTVFLIFMALPLVLRWQAPFGSFTYILTFNMLITQSVATDWRLVSAAFIAGVLIDLTVQWLNPIQKNRSRMYLFGFLLPVWYFASYMAVLSIKNTIWWSTHLIIGSILMCGLVGLALTAMAGLPSIKRS